MVAAAAAVGSVRRPAVTTAAGSVRARPDPARRQRADRQPQLAGPGADAVEVVHTAPMPRPTGTSSATAAALPAIPGSVPTADIRATQLTPLGTGHSCPHRGPHLTVGDFPLADHESTADADTAYDRGTPNFPRPPAERPAWEKGPHRLSPAKTLRTVGTTGFEPATP
ncbi:hypothetical protein ACIPC1_09800 [Streptomyces sp. NPDC087263]|uniref:hypothetical protein n=1 Tax=Streptomyces sp. NPDC087263 TaxID=3365773 RepID=UPI003814AF52